MPNRRIHEFQFIESGSRLSRNDFDAECPQNVQQNVEVDVVCQGLPRTKPAWIQ